MNILGGFDLLWFYRGGRGGGGGVGGGGVDFFCYNIFKGN